MDRQKHIQQLKRRERVALGRAITLVESQRDDLADQGREILQALEGDANLSACIGITGPPGVGKSTFVEALGMQCISRGMTVCALTVDPSSPQSKGSILGDKTRMELLGREPQAYIRSSPSGGEKGGLSERSYDVLRLCRSVGFDIVLLESVGVGQAEIDIQMVSDISILLAQPGSGDSLQGIKKGVMEIADMILVTKADGELASAAREAARQLRQSLQIRSSSVSEGRKVPVQTVSSLSREGISKVLDSIQKELRDRSGPIQEKRKTQEIFWLEHKARRALERTFFGLEPTRSRLDDIRASLRDEESSFYQALSQIQKYIDEKIR